eukprot:TRINITY_DN9017_c0_g2_i1.p1 TRINITY_DN9017_c0_g2~~TRINITY_DN9017_c0_g2_i1.p1  ORF type:complete len:126 (-),score=8.49 TRINITY_DN9017_c0_g2_i1:13-390(-)
MTRQEIVIGSKAINMRKEVKGLLDHTTLRSLLRDLSEAPTLDSRVELIKTASKFVKSVYCAQVSEILEIASFAAERLAVVESFVPKIIDIDKNTFEKQILNRLVHEHERAKASLLLPDNIIANSW